MTLEEISRAAGGAFLAMAENIPSARILRDPRWGMQCQSSMRHPLANFAWVESPGIWQDLDLKIENANNFNVYVPYPEVEAPYLDGFRLALTQQTLVAEPLRRSHELRFLVEEAREVSERMRIADFMVTRFYHASSRDIRGSIARGLRDAVNLRLFRISDGRRGISAACALYVGEPVWGIYNVLVDEDDRRQGRGQSLVGSMLATCAAAGRTAQLQCNPNLVRWYTGMGFRPHSFLHIFCF